MKQSIEKIRHEYDKVALSQESLHSHPFEQFSLWLNDALKASVMEPNAMALATVSQSARPSVRFVLLKQFDARGLVFFTDRHSRKGVQLAAHPHAAATFWWKEIYRQVTFEGKVVKTNRTETVRYFAKRPRGAQLAALASLQSSPLASREELKEIYERLKKRYRGKPLPCPKNWGGYRLIPERIEFWQGHADRLHDRFLYVLEDKQWFLSRLFP